MQNNLIPGNVLKYSAPCLLHKYVLYIIQTADEEIFHFQENDSKSQLYFSLSGAYSRTLPDKRIRGVEKYTIQQI